MDKFDDKNSNGVILKFDDKYVIKEEILPENKSLASKCIEYIVKNNIDYDINYFVNNDVIKRFLIARENNEKESFNMWCTWVDWRLKYLPDKITLDSIKNELAIGKAFIHGFDPDKRPILIIKTGKHDPGKTDFDELNRFGIYLMEKACELSDKVGSKQIIAILDRKDSGFKNFDRRIIQKKGIVSMLQDFYAERLHKIYIIHVNFIFRTIFAIIRPFLSDRTNNKLVMCSSVDDLKKYISPDNLIKEHGGTSDYVYTIPKE